MPVVDQRGPTRVVLHRISARGLQFDSRAGLQPACCFSAVAVLYAARPTANTASIMLTAHPQREALHNEIHARPYERLTAPLALSHIALVGEADRAREHIAALLRKRHLPLPAED